MNASFFTPLNKQTTILTPNHRLALTLLKKYNYEQRAQGLSCWPTAAIYPLSIWIQELWDQDSAQGMRTNLLVLSKNQELILWEEVIAEQPESGALLKVSDLAKQARSAWSTLKLWRTSFHHPSFSLTDNCRYFQAWAEQFELRCQENQWIDSISLIDLLIEKIQNKQISLPQNLLLFDFTELAPQYKELLDLCAKQGVQVEHRNNTTSLNSSSHSNSHQIGLADEASEIQIMARWAKKILEREPEASIGCISAELEEKRESIISVFKAYFNNSESFNISAGKTLASYPLIQQALQLLTLSPKSVSFPVLNSILHSPFIGDAEKEQFKRIQLDENLRRRNVTVLSWSALLEDKQAASCEQLLTRIKAYLEQRLSVASTQKISAWTLHFAQLLELLGWPGEQSLNSTEYQAVQRWMDLLHETSALDTILAPLSYHKALHYLSLLAAKTYFQPETPDAAIQILGQLEGAGLPFDYLWVLGLDDRAWPLAPAPNPFIPHELQKSLNMPNATASRQLEYSLHLMEQYKKAAGQVIFSYAQRQGAEELRPSPLISNLRLIKDTELDLAPPYSPFNLLFNTKDLEILQDEQAAPIVKQTQLRGGAKIFELQAACPFKAFAKLRLDAQTLEETQAGLPAKNRGIILHKALELFWKEVKDQKTLLQFKSKQLRDKIHQVLTIALAEQAPFIQKNSVFYSLVQQRFEELLCSWLEFEKSRPSFSVSLTEEERKIELEHFPISIRVDRIDELAEGEKLLIDYKTGKKCDTQHWFGKRPDEPQLPLYSITDQEPVSGLAFAQLHSTKIGFKGISQNPLGLPGIQTLTEKTKADAETWTAQLEEWRLNLRQLFHDFQNGKAEVDPKDKAKTCHYCDLHSFCRIYEDNDFSYEQND